MFPILQIGPVAIQAPGLAILLALWLGLSLAERHAPEYNLSPEILSKLTFTVLVSGLLGGRVAYVFQYPQAFLKSPISLVSLNPDLFDFASGLAIGCLIGLMYGYRQALSFWRTLDALTPLFAVLAIGSALAHLASGEAFGQPADLPWAINLWGARRHPSQVYELVGAILVLGLLWPKKVFSLPGVTCLRFVALTAGLRLFLEAFRGDSIFVFGGLRLAQLLAWLVLAVSLALIFHKERQAISTLHK